MLDKPMVYSHSRLETFESCPRKFKYQYVDRVEVPERDSVEAFLGTQCHTALETLYKNKLMGKSWTKDEFLKFYSDVWEKEKHDEIFIVNKQYSLQDYFNQGYDSLAKYWDRYYPFESEKTISLEQRIYMSLDNSDRYRLQGFIDRLSKKPDGTWQIRDYKTKRRLPTIDEAAKDRQLALYQLGIKKMWENVDKVELIWHYLLFDEEVKSTRDQADLEKLRVETIHVIQDVEEAIRTDYFPPHESALCDWCDYSHICPVKKHFTQVIQLSPKEFKANDGVVLADRHTELVNRKVELKEQLDEIEDLIKALEDEIIRYAEQLDAEVVYGSSRYVRVKSKETFRIPSSTNKEEKIQRQQLEDFLKQSKMWEEISILNWQRLVKMYESGELAEKIRTEVGQYLKPHREVRIYTGKVKDYDDNFTE